MRLRSGKTLAACAITLASLTTTACTAQEPAGISFIAAASDPEARPGNQMQFSLDRGDGWEQVSAHEGPFDTRSFDYPLEPGGTVQVRAALPVADGREVSLTLPVTVEADRAYGIVAIVSAQDPTAMCMGCGTPVSAALDAGDPAGTRLWLYETFNGISAPIMF